MTKTVPHFAYIPLINASGTDSNAPLKEAQGMIISGSIFPLKTIQKVGLYLDKFVMDAIDTEYFLRIRRPYRKSHARTSRQPET